jgi:hypothetical protein
MKATMLIQSTDIVDLGTVLVRQIGWVIDVGDFVADK